jgi:hypothetical protein
MTTTNSNNNTVGRNKTMMRRDARTLLEAAGLVGATATTTTAAVGLWPYEALNARLRRPSVVAAAARLFPTLIGRAMRRHPDTGVAGFVYEPSALLSSFLIAYHHRLSFEALMMMWRAEEVQAQMALVDAGVALAGTFETLLRALLSTTTTTTTTIPLQKKLLPQLRAYQGALAVWTEVKTPQLALLGRLTSRLEDLLQTRQRMCDLRLLLLLLPHDDDAGDDEKKEELDHCLVRIDKVIREVRNRLPTPSSSSCDDDDAAAVVVVVAASSTSSGA